MSTDPSSTDFDPLLALYSTDNDEEQMKDVKVFDNIAVFEGNLRRQQNAKTEAPGPSKQNQKSFSKRKKVEEEAKSRDVGKLKELMEMRKKIDKGENAETEEKKKEKISKPQKVKQRRTLLTSMEKLSKGPYSLLHKIVREHRRCNVYVRDFCGLRGVCSGYIVAFDRYMNMTMIDVDETYRKPPLGKVMDHQKSLSISLLIQAVRSLHLGTGGVKIVSQQDKPDHRPTTGVQIKTASSTKTSEEAWTDGKVKTVGTQFLKAETFHGGLPQLYHRHLSQLLVRGDSVIIVSLKDQEI